MSVQHPRNKLVNFRLSKEEFHQMGVACSVSGARSLSDFARNAVLAAVEQALESILHEPEQSIARLDEVVGSVETRLAQILKLLDAVQDEKTNPEAEGSISVR